MANTDCGTGGKVDEKVVNASVASAELESSALRSKEAGMLNSKEEFRRFEQSLNQHGNDDLADPVLKQKLNH